MPLVKYVHDKLKILDGELLLGLLQPRNDDEVQHTRA